MASFPNPLPAPTVINFDGGSFTGNVPAVSTPLVVGGPNGGVSIQRFLGNANYVSDDLRIGTAANDRNSQGNVGAVGFTFDAPQRLGYLGFFLANNTSPNEIVAFFRGNQLLQSFTGSDFLAGAGTGNYINFFASNSSQFFDRVLFIRDLADTDAFRIDNLAYQAAPIPTPALLPGLLAFGASVLRKRKAESTENQEA